MSRAKFLISVPYIYPVCPLSIDHAKIMLVADINARIARAEGKEVVFPIAAHYSGVTAEKSLENLYSDDVGVRNKERDKFIKVYNTPRNIVEGFKVPEDMLDYYTAQTILDLKRLGISCDYNNFYRTNDTDYEIFINCIFQNYDKNNVLVKNMQNDLALNYDDDKWRSKTDKNLKKLSFISPSLRNNIISSIDNIRSDWGILRNYGIGVKYKGNYVIDPMFDSELFVIYDLYKRFEKENSEKDKFIVFNEIIDSLKEGKNISKTNKLVKSVVSWMPTDLFVCEEHLKNWIIKKTFAETLLFNRKYYTKNYFITGMGYIDGKRMSSSRGTAVLLKDLLDKYGSTVTRMIIMFTGGHPSKMYNYSEENIIVIQKMLKDFYDYVVFINDKLLGVDCGKEYVKEFEDIYRNLRAGYYQQVLVDLMKNLRKKYPDNNVDNLKKIKNTLFYFMSILLPDLQI